MGLMQSAYETYEAMAGRWAGVYDDPNEVLAPVSHLVTRAGIEITIDLNGRFIRAVAVDKNAPKVAIPVTEKSAGRAGKDPYPHLLCDKIKYLSGVDTNKLQKYIDQLSEWSNFSNHPTLKAVLAYVKGGTLINDLMRADLLQYDNKGSIKNEDDVVIWRVEGSPTPDCWKDRQLFDAYIRFYNTQHAGDKAEICMLSGQIARPAIQHPKGVVALNGNAKLISANDSTWFTYRGRFAEATQALTISYEASQKAHAALRWLVTNQGVSYGGRTFICWNPQGREVPQIAAAFFRRAEPTKEPSDYLNALQQTLRGWQTKLPMTAGVVIAAFDAATTGRLALTYYNELLASDLLDRLLAWDATCCWWNGQYGIQSPALYNIASMAFGTRRDEKRIECDDKVLKQHIQRLIACRVDCLAMPQDIVRALVVKCENLGLYDNGLREKLLSTTCAVIRKYHNDLNEKEEWELALEPDKMDCSYQYGRLLAILEKAEQDTYESGEQRLPNAIRMQPMFVRQPQRTFSIVMEQIKKAYYPRLKPSIRTFYEKLIGEILDTISECPQDMHGAGLSDSYLMGYYLQKKELYTKKQNKDIEEAAE